MTRATADYAIRARDQTGGAFASLRRNLTGSQRLFGSLGRSAVAALGSAGLGLAVRGSLNAADNIGKLSKRLGATTEGLSELQHVAELSGVSFNTMTMGLQRMTRRVAEAANGAGEARGALLELGVDAQRLSQLRPEQQFEVLAEALAGVTSEGDQVRLAMKLFDSEGVALLQTMTDGAAGIQAMRAEARALGKSLSQEQVREIEAANDALTRMGAAVSGVVTQLATSLAPHLRSVGNVLSQVIGPAVDLLIGAFRTLGTFVGGIGASLGALFSGEFSMAGDIIKSTFADAFESVNSGFDKIKDIGATFAEAVTGDAKVAAAAVTDLGDKLRGTGRQRLSFQQAQDAFRKPAAAARSAKTGAFAELGLARIANAGSESTRPQKVESEQMAEMVTLLRQLLVAQSRGRVAVVG